MEDFAAEPNESLAVVTVTDEDPEALDCGEEPTWLLECEYCGCMPCGCGG
jgi:hypothetical protein